MYLYRYPLFYIFTIRGGGKTLAPPPQNWTPGIRGFGALRTPFETVPRASQSSWTSLPGLARESKAVMRAPKRPHESPKRPQTPTRHPNTEQRAFETQKTLISPIGFCLLFGCSVFRSSGRPRPPERPPGSPQDWPKRRQDGPRELQDGIRRHNRAQENPKKTPRRPKMAPRRTPKHSKSGPGR